MEDMDMKNTRVINFFAQPGSGKSTNTALLFGELKQMDIDCEIALEYAKELVWGENVVELADQICVLAGQLKKQIFVNGKVDFIITDSPILLSSFYNKKYNYEIFEKLCFEAFNKFENINILLKRVKRYNSNGRLQTEKESDEMADGIKNLLDRNDVKYIVVDGDENCVKNIIEYLKQNKYI